MRSLKHTVQENQAVPNMIKITILLLSVSLFSLVQATEDASFVGSFRFVKGQVTLEATKDKSTQNAVKEMLFNEGDKIVTKENSFAVLSLQDGSTIKMDANTELNVISLIGKKKEEYFGVSRIMLSIGGIMVDVVKKFNGPPSVEIDTKKKLGFGVRGTKFYTFIEQDSEDAWTVVYEGTVQAFDFAHDDSEMISAGKSLVAVEGERLTLPQEYIWSKKVLWNNDPDKGELDSRIVPTTAERQAELAQVLKKILDRKKKPFINTENNPRRMKDREIRTMRIEAKEEENDSNDATASVTTEAAVHHSKSSTGKVSRKVQEILASITQNDPSSPKPIAITERDGNGPLKATCDQVADSGFPCLVREHDCLSGEISAAIYYTADKVFHVCVKIINGIFL